MNLPFPQKAREYHPRRFPEFRGWERMDDGMDRCPVFCIADIPIATLDLLLQSVEDSIFEFCPGSCVEASDEIVIMDTKDISIITEGSSPGITSSPTAFLDHTLQEIYAWFDMNITQPHARGFTRYCFLVLDDKTTEDNSCIFVCTEGAAPGEIPSLRCTFDMASPNIICCNFQGHSIEEGVMGNFMRSGVTMTRARSDLVSHSGLYIDEGEVKVSEYWRDFRNW